MIIGEKEQKTAGFDPRHGIVTKPRRLHSVRFDVAVSMLAHSFSCISLACDLHLNGTLDADSSAVDTFLTGSPNKLFVWRHPDDDSIQASVDSIPKDDISSTVLVICKSKPDVTDASDLQSLTVRSVIDLRRYVSECFRPFVEDEAATAKLRELELALTASQRSTRLPHVILHPPPASSSSTSTDQDETLNELQNTVKEWIDQIRRVTDLVEDTPFDQENEIAFWNALGREIANIQEQLQSPEIQSTLNILREAKRFVAVLALENNTNLEQAATTTLEVNNFLKALPLPKLMAAREFSAIVETASAVFENLTKIRATRSYSLERSVQLVSFITAVIRDAVKETLELTPNWMLMDYKEYETKIYFPVTDVFAQLEDWLASWRDFTIDLARRRKTSSGLNRLIENMELLHKPLQDRLDKIHEFRSNHEQLRSVVHSVLRQEEPEALQQVEQAPRQFWAKVSDFYEDSKSFQMALDEYDLEMDAMEERLARLLRDKLQACKVRPNQGDNFANISIVCSFSGCRGHVPRFCSLQSSFNETSSSCCCEGVPVATDFHCFYCSGEIAIQVYPQVRDVRSCKNLSSSRYPTGLWKNSLGEANGTASEYIDGAHGKCPRPQLGAANGRTTATQKWRRTPCKVGCSVFFPELGGGMGKEHGCKIED